MSSNRSRSNSAHQRLGAKQAALRVVRRLRVGGHQALLAGGCVRDMLLGKVPADYDVATNAQPQTVCQLFSRTLTVGAQFGVVVVLIGGRQIEVATFRSDASYTDGRRPDKVVFTDARHDAQRRDFTINGMFFDPIDNQVIDYVNGKADLKKGVIRAIGAPEKRFAEDHLRMLRAIRFACRFQFKIAPATWQAICAHAPAITHISAERIADELERILVDPHRAVGGQLALKSGLLEPILKPLSLPQLHIGLDVLGQLPQRTSFALALAALLSADNEQTAQTLCRRLKTSNELRQQVRFLVANREKLLAQIPLSRGPLKKWLAQPLFEPLVQLIRCHEKAQGRSLAKLNQLRRQITDLGDEPIAPPQLLDGHDLIRLGVAPGPRLGQLLEELYLAQLENHVRTTRQAQQWIRQRIQRTG